MINEWRENFLFQKCNSLFAFISFIERERTRVSASHKQMAKVLELDHVFLAMPPGGIDRARSFYQNLLGLLEIQRPRDLLSREGAWFLCGRAQLHIGVEEGFRALRRPHVALVLDDLNKLIERLKAENYAIAPSQEDIPGVELRAFTHDPFGNRLELLQLQKNAPAPIVVTAAAPSTTQLTSVSPSPNPSTAPVLLLGDARLREISTLVSDFKSSSFKERCALLSRTLTAFREANGFGRAISAPQIGVCQRFIAMNLGKGVFFVVNPVITWKSQETFTMWDDCMSFPDLLVKVQRHRSISIKYQDEEGQEHEWTKLDLPTSELLQHEIDHLDGVLAVDRAFSGQANNSIVIKSVFEKNKEVFRKQVDYVIGE